MNNVAWGSEEFETCLTKGIIGLCENQHRLNKKMYKAGVPEAETISFLKKSGTYIPPVDRAYDTSGEIDFRVNSLPDFAKFSCGLGCDINHSDYIKSYIDFAWIKRQYSTPKHWHKIKNGLLYSVFKGNATENDGISFTHDMVTVDKDGVVSNCYCEYQYHNGFQHVKHRLPINVTLPALFSIVVGAWNERKLFWNVSAKESGTNILFGIYEEEIKSLFYSRSLPVTGTGRKSPILHWVHAHKRRMREGVDIDVTKHLRGINKFEMGGTLFEITEPIKIAA